MLKSIAAISRQGKTFAALAVKVRSGHAEVIGFERWTQAELDFERRSREFVDRYLGGQGGHLRPVMCFDKVKPAYYELELPPVKEEQIGAAVAMQAETVLPMPEELMRIDWKASRHETGVKAVLAGVHIKLEDRLRDAIGLSRPSHIWLTAEAIAAASEHLFEQEQGSRVVVYVDRECTWICVIDEAGLRGGSCSEVGLADLFEGDRMHSASAEKLAQDIYHTVLRHDEGGRLAVEIIGGGDVGFGPLADYLGSLSLAVRVIEPLAERVVRRAGESGEEAPVDLYDMLIPLGLSFMAVGGPQKRFELFKDLQYQPSHHSVRVKAPPLGLSVTAAVLMGVLVLLASFGQVRLRARQADESIGQLQKQFEQQCPDITIQEWEHLQETRQVLSRMRPDILELWSLVHRKTPKTIQLEEIRCVAGEPVEVSALVKGKDKKPIYEYQDILIAEKGLERVMLSPINYNDKEKRQNFTISFEYGLFRKTVRKSSSLRQVPQL